MLQKRNLPPLCSRPRAEVQVKDPKRMEKKNEMNDAKPSERKYSYLLCSHCKNKGRWTCDRIVMGKRSKGKKRVNLEILGLWTSELGTITSRETNQWKPRTNYDLGLAEKWWHRRRIWSGIYGRGSHQLPTLSERERRREETEEVVGGSKFATCNGRRAVEERRKKRERDPL